jgi:glycosyltransferase involved in cell wall biosynthesis
VKVLLVAHGYPPELVGGTELAVQALARGLAAGGDEVVVVAGSVAHEEGFRTSTAEDQDPATGAALRVHRIHRADFFFDHWQKSLSARVAGAFTELLAAERPDVVHVHHWIRLTRDLVACAARAGVPSVVTLHDLWTTCLVTFRVRPDTGQACDATLAAKPCLACADLLPPRTPFVPFEQQYMALAERRVDTVRELTLARAVLTPTRAHSERVARYLGLDPGALALTVVPHGRDLALERRAPLAPPAELGRLVLGSWGHLHPLKGADVIVAALRRLAGETPVTLHLAGEESDPEFVAKLRGDAAGLDVQLHGGFDAAALDRHPVTAVHAMVSATRAPESWGLVLDEAVALGLPLVLPANDAFVERLPGEERGALHYAPGDVDELAAALRRLAGEPDLLPALRDALPVLADVAPPVAEHVRRTRAVYADVRAAGAPGVPPVDWWAARMQTTNEEDWDRRLAATDPAELGFES